jgi:hypothetical protein
VLRSILVLLLLLSALGLACELPITGAPLSIDYYTLDSSQTGRVVVDAIFTNQTQRAIDALHLGFVAVNANHEVVSSQTGLMVRFQGSLAPEEQDAMRWYFKWALAEENSTVAYVRGVRFSDGDLWQIEGYEVENQIAGFECPNAAYTRFLVKY